MAEALSTRALLDLCVVEYIIAMLLLLQRSSFWSGLHMSLMPPIQGRIDGSAVDSFGETIGGIGVSWDE